MQLKGEFNQKNPLKLMLREHIKSMLADFLTSSCGVRT